MRPIYTAALTTPAAFPVACLPHTLRLLPSHSRHLTTCRLPNRLHRAPSPLPPAFHPLQPIRLLHSHSTSAPSSSPPPPPSSTRRSRLPLAALVVVSSLLLVVYITPPYPAESENEKLHSLAHTLANTPHLSSPSPPTPSPSPTPGTELSPSAADATAEAAGANHPSSERAPGSKPRLVILGSGWGAVSLLKGLDRDAYEVTVISPRNYFLFTPLLPSATTGQVESRSLIEPIRRICHRIGAHYFEARATDVDPTRRLVVCQSFSGFTFTLPYDHLVVAVGAKNNTFDTPGVNEYTYFLKEIRHARKIRHKLLSLLEEASLPGLTREERERMLHFVVVGGGPTGVEFAGEFHDLLVEDVRELFPDLTAHVSLSVIQSQDHILNTYDLRISEVAEQQFRKMDINLITGARVKEVKAEAVLYLDKKTGKMMELPFGMCVWSTGIDTVAFTKQLMERLQDAQDAKKGKALLTDAKLRVRGSGAQQRIYAVGDCASVSLTNALAQDPVMKEIFESTDKDEDGRLSYHEFYELVDTACKEAPILSSTLESSNRRSLFDKYDVNNDGAVDYKEFKAIMKDIVSRTATHTPRHTARHCLSHSLATLPLTSSRCAPSRFSARGEVVPRHCPSGLPAG